MINKPATTNPLKHCHYIYVLARFYPGNITRISFVRLYLFMRELILKLLEIKRLC
jgi:hypothetical protein